MSFTSRKASFLFSVITATLLQGSFAHAAILNFSGTSYNTGDFTMNGSSSASNGNLQLTNSGGYEAGSSFTNKELNITSFTTSFAFQLKAGTNPQADGITFCIQNSGVNALGGTGGGLGYGQDTPGASGAHIDKSIAIKFDTWNNAGEGTNSTGLYQNGASPTAPSVSLNGTGINLTSQDPFLVSMAYANNMLQVNIQDETTGAVATQSYNINIASVIGSNFGYVGFTGGTGGATSTQSILNMGETPNTPNTPEPGSMALLAGSAVSGFCWFRRRQR